jgi:hypothetical protein
MNYIVGYIIYELLTTIEAVDLKFQLNKILTMRLCKLNHVFDKFEKYHIDCILNIS